MKKTIYLLVVAVLCLNFKSKAQEFAELSGQVTSASGKPLAGATVKIKSGPIISTTDKNGNFSINTGATTGTLIISFLGYQSKEVTFDTKNVRFIEVILQESENDLTEVTIVSTGYQNIPKERATGSFTKPDKRVFEARISTDILSKLEGITSGVVFNSGVNGAAPGKPDINIRGRSTIYSNDQPLIIVDNFPYTGNINDLNPQDVESVDILKDAAAASVWGVKAGNGVIVITTKKGQFNQRTKINSIANFTIGAKPNLKYDRNFLPAKQYIDLQQFLFRNGKYDNDLLNTYSYPVIPAAVEIMAQKRSGQISLEDSVDRISNLKRIDIRDGLLKHFYTNPINQQYGVNISSGTTNSSYYFSTGYDKTQTNQKTTNSDRLTLNFSNNYSPSKNLEINIQLNYVLGNNYFNAPLSLSNATSIGGIFYPYTAFTDKNGNPQSVNRSYSNVYKALANQSNFLNWDYVPLAELNSEKNTNKTEEARIFTGIKYTVLKNLSIEAKYQYQRYQSQQSNLQGMESYSTRNLINNFSNLTDGKVTSYNIPLGDILILANSLTTSNNLRGQINYQHNGKHSVSAILGAEVIENKNNTNSNTLYGYNSETDNFTAVNYYKDVLGNPLGGGYIPSGIGIGNGTDRFRSYFANASYTYDYKYTISASARLDGSNYFGVATNQKTVPLWSAGIKWNALQSIQLRATYGYNGNLNKSVTGITTLKYNANALWTNLPYAVISNIGNSKLRWEKNGILNLGIDFSTKNNFISGSIDYFIKRGTDIIGDQTLAPSVGYSSPNTGTAVLRGNFANIKGSGIDFVINTRNINSNFTWLTSLNFSYATDQVTKFDLVNNNYSSFAGNGTAILPIVGKPVYALYSYKWGGLDHNTGNPQGYISQQISSDYSALTSPASIEGLVYNGPSRPKYFGGLSNHFSYQRLTMMFSISYKLGYYFRRSTINYNTLFNGGATHQDFAFRWQNPGDEESTTVPSLLYPASNLRDYFYTYSEATVEKADHIRLKDVSISYDVLKSTMASKPSIQKLQIFAYANNLGLIWKANRKGIDPDFSNGGIPSSRTISIGIKAHL
ncbi:SusC/RagA family TonB-linked outer membrane protein [Pedobacter gandavensis]|uniref:SusC/RagA family TonB-linked outer membrane protein n=1 Tax=Pedobacter gandavensis TaxID=2679963 RepID=UPI0024792647|nr:SusC/RagA family TonB-linked outer membrane protein [Pedobacter gandavensis]WGQ10748.1 SusC/RagA family TonB-linked outer membrane protein [Pedobacter gandavensis]